MSWTVHPNNKRIRFSSWDLKVEERQAYPDGCQKRRYWWVLWWTNIELSVMNKILKVETILFGIWFGFVFPMLGFYRETVTWKIASQSPQSLATSYVKDKNPFDIICKTSNKCFKDHWSLLITILLLLRKKNRTRCSCWFSKETDMWKIAFLGIFRDLDFTFTSVQHRFSCHLRNLIFFRSLGITDDR